MWSFSFKIAADILKTKIQNSKQMRITVKKNPREFGIESSILLNVQESEA
jgi:hypothetical protein